MDRIIKTLALLGLSLYIAAPAHAGWSCAEPHKTTVNPQECTAAGSQQTPEAFANLFIKELEKKNPSRAPYTLDGCTENAKGYICNYSFMIGTSKLSSNVSAIQDQAASCPETLESSSDNVAVTQSGGKYFVAWSARQAADICHNSCSYMGDSASISTCYRVKGSTNTGFCNYFLGLNSASPSCSGESGYKAPRTGDSLSSGADTGGGGNTGGGDGSGNNGGSSGNGGNGGTGGSGGNSNGGGSGSTGFDGELKFTGPGDLDASDILDSERNETSYKAFVVGLESSWNESEFGESVNKFKETILTTGTSSTCPTYTIRIYLGTFVIDSHCEIYNNSDLASIMTTVFMAAWSILGLRIVLSA